MFLHPDTIALPVFAAVMAIAAYEDFRRLVIPNLLPAKILVGGNRHHSGEYRQEIGRASCRERV